MGSDLGHSIYVERLNFRKHFRYEIPVLPLLLRSSTLLCYLGPPTRGRHCNMNSLDKRVLTE